MLLSRKRISLILIITFVLTMTAVLSGCSEEDDSYVIKISGDMISQEITYSINEMKEFESGKYEGVYSTINNWPNFKEYAGRGITIESILKEIGVYDDVQSITFKSEDSYEATFTRSQLLDEKQYYFPNGDEESDRGRVEVEPIIAYESSEDGKLENVKETKPALIIGQRNHLEHTNPVFVENISEIILSSEETEKFDMATTFPLEGNIAKGETVKLQHGEFGLVKLFYTTDGSEPTEYSNMYNPSTYQPELNVPITIEEDVTIKVLVTGYGKENSDIAEFHFKAI